MTKVQAHAIYNILVAYAGASESGRDNFVRTHTSDRCDEYRFIGLLGFGGKFWRDRWQVTAYPEDMTPERKRTIEETNAALAQLRELVTP